MKKNFKQEQIEKLKKNHELLKLFKIENTIDHQHLSRLLNDNYVAQKCNRERRIPEQLLYIETFAQELLEDIPDDTWIVDIGPGPGEFLEVCRFLGYKTKGYDAILEDCEMGDEYALYSSLMAKRQKLDIEYVGFENLISSLPFEDESVLLINSRGSIEQVFKKYLKGISHRVHKEATYLCWQINKELKNTFSVFLKEIERILKPGGVFLIFGNGAMNTSEYDKMLQKLILDTPGLFLEKQFSFENRLHKIRKGPQ